MEGRTILEILYIIVLVLVCVRIIYETRNTTKTLAYLLLAILVPIIGMLFFFFFGTNYRNRKLYSKKLVDDGGLARKLKEEVFLYSKKTLAESDASVKGNKELAYLLVRDSVSPLTPDNHVRILVNGEEKFPDVLEAMQAAKHHIHIEYYIYEDDEIGKEVENMLVQKVREGVAVRFIYDDYGCRAIRGKLIKRLKANGVQAFPFYKIYFIPFANRINYRNHRKIIVIDGQTAFTGGINISDRYINKEGRKQVYWRDTHLRIDGPGAQYLQYLFICDWNFCADYKLTVDRSLFLPRENFPKKGDKVVQIAASGPDSETPTILFSILQAINLATKEILITSPYFIPSESLLDALVIASLSGISVKLLVPFKSDSVVVNTAAKYFYGDLLRAGVHVYQYKKGFIHAKTMVTDREIAIVGTANMDIRSFDFNFEVNAIVYDTEIAGELADIFYKDIEGAERIDPRAWEKRPFLRQLLEKTARLISPLL